MSNLANLLASPLASKIINYAHSNEWTPLSIPSCLILLDFQDWSTIFTDETGTTPVSSQTQLVASVRDKKSNILFTQSNSSLRPTVGREPLSGIRNLILHTENYSNSTWVKNGTSVATNVATSPIDGLTTVDRVWPSSANSQKNVTLSWLKHNQQLQYTLSVYAKADGYNILLLQFDSGSDTNSVVCSFNLASGTAQSPSVSGTYSSASSAITSLGNGWYRCSITATTGTETTIRAVHWIDSVSAYIGANSSTTGILLCGSQLEQGQISPYQRVNTLDDIYESSVQSRYSVFVSGSATVRLDSNVDLSAVNNLTICSGLRPRAGTGNRVIINQNLTNTSSFYQSITSANLIESGSRGSGTHRVASVSGYIPEKRFVGTSFHSISGPSVKADYNNTIGTANTLSQGTGNFSNGLVRLFARTDNILVSPGNYYSIAIFSSILSGNNLTNVKNWIAKKSGVIL